MANINNVMPLRTLSALVARIKGGHNITEEEIKRFHSRGLNDWEDKEKPHYTLMEYALITANLSNFKILAANEICAVHRNPYSILIEQSALRDSDLKDTIGIIHILSNSSDIPIPEEFTTSEIRKKSPVGTAALKYIAEIREHRAKEHDNKKDNKM